MSIIGFNFNKISVERKQECEGRMGIKNNLAIKNIKDKEIGVTAEQSAFEAEFDYAVDYHDEKKSFAKISLQGSLIFLGEKALIEETIAQYKKNKVIKQDIVGPLLNYTFNKCTIQAIILSKEINLPPPIQLPRLKVEAK